MARMTLVEIRARRPEVDRAKIEATTAEDIGRHMVEDGELPAGPVSGLNAGMFVRRLRKTMNMTQEEFAFALRVPLATVRNWEQGRVVPDPAARSLLRIVERDPKAAVAALSRIPA